MSGATEGKLEQAYDLIRQERLDEAVSILQPLLINESQNADVWWLWANAVREPEDARHALHKVLEYSPQHASARQQLAKLDELYPPVPEAAFDSLSFGETTTDFEDLYGDTTTREAIEAPELPELPAEMSPSVIQGLDLTAEGSSAKSTAVDFGWLDDDEEELGLPDESGVELPDIDETSFIELDQLEEEGVPEETETRRRPLLRLVLVALLVVALGAAVVIAASNLGGKEAPAATEAPAVAGVEEPSDTMKTVLEAAASAANAQQALLGGPATAELEVRDGLPALVIRVCRPANTDLSNAMGIAMEMAARYSVSAQDELGAAGADLVNCTRNDLLLSAVAPIDRIIAFANGNLTRDEFRATWQWQ